MRLYKGKGHVPTKFSGNVKITITAIDNHGQLMSARQGMKAEYVKVMDTTPGEVKRVIQEAIIVEGEK